MILVKGKWVHEREVNWVDLRGGEKGEGCTHTSNRYCHNNAERQKQNKPWHADCPCCKRPAYLD